MNIIRSFHDDTEATRDQMLKEIKVNNGLCQGCTIAPTLFNLYACARSGKVDGESAEDRRSWYVCAIQVGQIVV